MKKKRLMASYVGGEAPRNEWAPPGKKDLKSKGKSKPLYQDIAYVAARS